jgi:hypothetical protein
MFTRQTILILTAALFVALVSCEDDGPPTGGGHRPIDQLPSQIGMLWKYQVYDSLTQTTDTVWVSVTDPDPRTITGTQGFVWWYNWITRYSVQPKTVTISGDTVALFTDTAQTEPDPRELLIFPLELDREWTEPFGSDTSRVTATGTKTVPAGTFTGAACVERIWNRDFEGGYNQSTTWIARNVGIVSRHYFSESNLGDGTFIVTTNRTWELYDYDLSTFSLGQFPNTVGTEWDYQLVDTLVGLVDTVTVRVVGKIQNPTYDSLMVWVCEGREYRDTMFVATDGQVVSEFFDTLVVMPFVAWPYEFPMAVGRHWGIYTFAPIPQVDDKAPISTPSNRYSSAFHYQSSGIWPHDFWLVDDWLVPGVGVVKRRFSRWVPEPVSAQEWTLLDFRPPE